MQRKRGMTTAHRFSAQAVIFITICITKSHECQPGRRGVQAGKELLRVPQEGKQSLRPVPFLIVQSIYLDPLEGKRNVTKGNFIQHDHAVQPHAPHAPQYSISFPSRHTGTPAEEPVPIYNVSQHTFRRTNDSQEVPHDPFGYILRSPTRYYLTTRRRKCFSALQPC